MLAGPRIYFLHEGGTSLCVTWGALTRILPFSPLRLLVLSPASVGSHSHAAGKCLREETGAGGASHCQKGKTQREHIKESKGELSVRRKWCAMGESTPTEPGITSSRPSVSFLSSLLPSPYNREQDWGGTPRRPQKTHKCPLFQQ